MTGNLKRIEEMVKLIKTKSSFGFYVSLFLIISFLIVILLVNDIWIKLVLGVLILLILVRFVGIFQERD
jgi:hypothetical protein